MSTYTRDKAREAISNAGITSENVTIDQLEILMMCIDIEMFKSGNYRGSYRLDKEVSKFMTCSTDLWDGREAISFNRDGFIGFAGWAGDCNVKPILIGVDRWLNQITKSPAGDSVITRIERYGVQGWLSDMRKSGIIPLSKIAAVTTISIRTLYNWTNGATPTRANLELFKQALRKAIEEGRL